MTVQTEIREDELVNTEALHRAAKELKGIDLAGESHESPESENSSALESNDTSPETQVQTPDTGSEEPQLEELSEDSADQSTPEEKKRNLESRFNDLLDERKESKDKIAELQKQLENMQLDLQEQQQPLPEEKPNRYERYTEKELHKIQSFYLTGEGATRDEAVDVLEEVQTEFKDRIKREVREEQDKEKKGRADQEFAALRGQYQQRVLSIAPDYADKNHALVKSIDEAYTRYGRDVAEGPLVATLITWGDELLKLLTNPSADSNMRNFAKTVAKLKALPNLQNTQAAVKPAVPQDGGNGQQPVPKTAPPPNISSQRASINPKGTKPESKKLMDSYFDSGGADKALAGSAIAQALRELNAKS